MSHSLDVMPATARLYGRAFATLRRRPGKTVQVPPLDVRIAAVQVDPARLRAYRLICGFEDDGNLPLTFAQVQAMPLHLWLMLRPEFPMPLMGIVHLRNRFETMRPMPAGASYDIRARLVDGRRTHQGCEFDILTEYHDPDGTLCHRALMTPLYRMKSPGIPRPPRMPPPQAALADYLSFDVAEDIGRRYAPIAGDFNPIHLYALSARLFGFPRAIAHGMWAVARAAALLEQAHGRTASRLEVQFRQPLLLPGKVALRHRPEQDRTAFALLSRGSDKIHFTGTLS